MANYRKQRHGHVNPIFLQEERAMIAVVEKSEHSTTNSQILGRNGETGIRDFFNRYLPSCFRAVTGHFVTPSGKLSPECDIILMDSRYPLLSQSEDGSVVVMLHSVIATIEVKLTLIKREIVKIRQDGKKILELHNETFPVYGRWGSVMQFVVAYRSGVTLPTVVKQYFADWSDYDPPPGQVQILRVHPSDQFGDEGPIGASVWLENGNLPSAATSLAPLSDFYYSVVQCGFYTLAARGYEFGQLGEQMMKYMAWGTFPCVHREF